MVRNVSAKLKLVLEDAALLQQKVPDAVLVGGSVAAMYADHRYSEDHDHVLENLHERFTAVLEALEADPEYVINRVTPGKIILGEHNGIEYGIRQMLRQRPLEVVEEMLESGNSIRVPTIEEALRIKAYLLLKRNTVRDYLDVAALASSIGIEVSAKILRGIDAYYADPSQEKGSVASQILVMLTSVDPEDKPRLRQLKEYKGLSSFWQNWTNVFDVLNLIAKEMI